MRKDKLAKCLSITETILSISLASFGLYIIFIDYNFLLGFTYISIGFSVGINDWIKIFKNK